MRGIYGRAQDRSVQGEEEMGMAVVQRAVVQRAVVQMAVVQMAVLQKVVSSMGVYRGEERRVLRPSTHFQTLAVEVEERMQSLELL